MCRSGPYDGHCAGRGRAAAGWCPFCGATPGPGPAAGGVPPANPGRARWQSGPWPGLRRSYRSRE